MSTYTKDQKTTGDFQFMKRNGQVEMEYNPTAGSYAIYLYEHDNTDEEFLMHCVKYSKESADRIFETTVRMLK